MRTSSAHLQGAGAAVSGPAGRRPTNIEELEELRFRLDELILDLRYRSPRTPHAFERVVDEAESIGAGIRGVFRGRTLAERAPLALKAADGRSQAWW